MNAQNASRKTANTLFTIAIKATYAVGYVGINSTRTVTDTVDTPFEDEIETLVDHSFKDIVNRMVYNHLFSEEDKYTASTVPRVQKEARKRVLDAIWNKMHDGFSAKVSFNDGFDPYESEISGIPTTLEISVAKKENETKNGLDTALDSGLKNETKAI